MDILYGILIPFLGTSLGASMVFIMKNKMSTKVQKIVLGFASGVMIAASIWSLIMPAIEMAKEQGIIAWLPATVGFLLGILFLLIIDNIMPLMEIEDNKAEGNINKFKNTTMMIFAVTLHNIPEGMAVGVTFAGVMLGNTRNNNGRSICFSNSE